MTVTTSEVRGDPSAVDAAWLTSVLEDAGVARGAEVIESELVCLVGTGQMGRSARFRLTWDDPVGRPATVVGKFPAEDATARSTGFSDAGSYWKEWVFYTQLKPQVGVRTPTVWAALFDADAQQFVLLMEDLDQSVQGDQMRGLTVDEAALAVEQAVAFHAPTWGNTALPSLLGSDPEADAAQLVAYYGATVDGTLARLGHHIDEPSLQLVRDLVPLMGEWALASPTPQALIHRDFRPDNLLFGATPEAPPIVVVDWQTIAYGPAGWDVAYLIGGAFEPEARAAAERDLVEEYRSQLVAAGVTYSEAACWDDYRLGSLWGVAMSVIATMLAAQTERGDEMLATMLRRHTRHALDLEALELVRGASA